MSTKLSSQLIQDIKLFLLESIDLEDPERRKQLARNALFPEILYQKIGWQAKKLPFADDFMIQCQEWKEYDINDPRNPLEEYLKTLAELEGGDRKKRLQYLLDHLAKELGPSTNQDTPPEIEFVNREKEILYFGDKDSTVTRYAIHAPAGFGKTWLLKKLQLKFKTFYWLASYVQWSPNITFLEFSNRLIQSIDCSDNLDSNIDPTELPKQLAEIFKREWKSKFSSEKGGIVLLIDCGNIPSEDEQKELHNLISVWLELFTKEIQGLRIFSSENNLFRILIAGRFFRQDTIASLKSYQFHVHTLEPFDEALEQSVKRYLPDIGREWQTELWTNLYYLTGGHPGCFSKILKWYWEQEMPSPDYFFQKKTREIQKNILDEVEVILADFLPETKNLLLALCPFRSMSYEVLDDILNSPEKFLTWDKDVLLLQDHLTRTHLVYVDKYGILRDSISRRIMTLHLRYSEDAKTIHQKCLQAKNIYIGRLKDVTEQQFAHLWAIEYLYLTLLSAETPIKTIKGRQDLRQSFWGNDDNITPPNTDLYNCLNLLANDRDVRRLIRPLQGALNEDWDFQFTLNYFFRSEHFENKWFSILISKIQAYFYDVADKSGNVQ